MNARRERSGEVESVAVLLTMLFGGRDMRKFHDYHAEGIADTHARSTMSPD